MYCHSKYICNLKTFFKKLEADLKKDSRCLNLLLYLLAQILKLKTLYVFYVFISILFATLNSLNIYLKPLFFKI